MNPTLFPTPRARHGFSQRTILGLALLGSINLFPLLLILRQALAPESESVRWPLQLLPDRLSLENLRGLWQSQTLVRHVLLSLWVALGTTLLSLLLGFPAGWAAARSNFMERWLTRLAMGSRILPPIAVAIPLTALLIPVRLYNHPLGLGLILAHLTLGLPVAVLLAYTTFRVIPRELEEAAHVDGCTPLGAFIRVAMPSARGAMGGVFILVFLISWDEFAYALLIQVTNRTLPPLVYYYTEFGQLASASTLAAIMLVPAILVIVFLQRLIVRGALAGGINE